jgi:hypothetical protein
VIDGLSSLPPSSFRVRRSVQWLSMSRAKRLISSMMTMIPSRFLRADKGDQGIEGRAVHEAAGDALLVEGADNFIALALGIFAAAGRLGF